MLIIGTAVGVVMERYGLDQAEAFAYLMRQFSTQNQTLQLVAKDLVDHTDPRADGPQSTVLPFGVHRLHRARGPHHP